MKKKEKAKDKAKVKCSKKVVYTKKKEIRNMIKRSKLSFLYKLRVEFLSF